MARRRRPRSPGTAPAAPRACLALRRADVRVVGAADADGREVSCTPRRSGGRTPSRRRASPGPDAGSSEASRPPRLAYRRACSRRVDPGRPLRCPDGHRDRRHPRHLDDHDRARARLRAGLLLGRGRGRAAAPHRARRRHARRRAPRGEARGLRPRQLAAGAPEAALAAPLDLDHERHARDRGRRRAVRARVPRRARQPRGRHRSGRRARRRRRRSSAPASRASPASTTRTSRAGSPRALPAR